MTSVATRIAVANAPCSYGAFEITVGVNPDVPEPLELLDAVSGAGYAGIDLGPLGYLGTGTELVERLHGRGLALAGGYLELPYTDADALAAELPRLEGLLDVFDAVGADTGAAAAPPPRPTLADAGSLERSRFPGRAATDRSIGWDDATWGRFAEGLGRVVARCRERGYEPAFHHHTATYVEAQWEIERLLELTEVGLCLDTGHLLLGGGDPVTAIRAWGDRINHLHLKDARLDVLRGIVDDAAPVEEIWRRRAFCALGEGDVAVDEVLAALQAIGYEGWLVVEQDIVPGPEDPPGQAAREQAANRAFLRARGL
jgi:inosose dehydratase